MWNVVCMYILVDVNIMNKCTRKWYYNAIYRLHIYICDHACINEPLGAKVERREIVNAFTIIPILFQYLNYNAHNFGMEGSIKKLKRSAESA